MQEPFDMDAFLNDLREDDEQPATISQLALLWATLHHLWKDHPLKISQSINLVALSEDLAFDLSDVQYIRRSHHDESYMITFKSDPSASLYVHPSTPAYTSLLTLMHLFNKQPEH